MLTVSLKKEKRKILLQIMEEEVIPMFEKSKYNFLQHHELDSEEKIVNKIHLTLINQEIV